MPLVNRPDAYAEESLQGFLLRLAEANGYPTVDWLKRIDTLGSELRARIGKSLYGFVPKWLTIDETRQMTSAGFSPIFCLGSRGRFCPACLSTAPYWRALWEHRLYIACHIHNLRMIDACPSCDSAIGWSRSALIQCPCGFLFKTGSHELASEHSYDSARQIANAFLKEVTDKSNEVTKAGVFDHLSLDSTALLIAHLGITSSITEQFLSPRLWRTQSLSDTDRLISVAYSRLADWPLKFHEFLSEDQSHAIALQNGSMRSLTVERLAKFLRRDLPQDLTFLLDGYRSFVRNNSVTPLSRRQRWANQPDIESHAYLSATVAARQLGIRAASIHALAEVSGVREISSGRGQRRRFTLIERASLDALKLHLREKTSLRVARGLLGLSSRRVDQLADVGILQRERVIHGLTTTSFFSRTEILRLLSTLFSGASLSEQPGQGLLVANACKYFVTSRAEFIALVCALRDKRLSIHKSSEAVPNFAGAMLDEAEYMQWRFEQSLAEEMTVAGAAEALNVKQEVAYHLVRAGVLNGKLVQRGRRIAFMVPSSALAQFSEDYVLCSHVAKQFHTSPKTIASVLSLHGIKPVCGPHEDGCRQIVFRRNEIEPICRLFTVYVTSANDSEKALRDRMHQSPG